jgi:sugar-phosphatase
MHAECDALLFDIDGTLVDSTAAVERVWRRWADEYGVDAEAVIAVSHGLRNEDAVARVLPEDQVPAATRRLTELELADLEGVVAIRGAAELLDALDGTGSGSTWAAVTSGPRDLMRARLAAAGLPAPPVLVTAEDVAVGKPDPQGYRAAAAALGADPARCVVVEDAPAGVAAGRGAGARVIAVAGTYPAQALIDLPDGVAPDAVVPDLTAVRVSPDGGGLLVRVGPVAD